MNTVAIMTFGRQLSSWDVRSDMDGLIFSDEPILLPSTALLTAIPEEWTARAAYRRPILAFRSDDDLLLYRMSTKLNIEDVSQMDAEAFDLLLSTNKAWAKAAYQCKVEKRIIKSLRGIQNGRYAKIHSDPVKAAISSALLTVEAHVDELSKIKLANQRLRAKREYKAALNAFKAAVPSLI